MNLTGQSGLEKTRKNQKKREDTPMKSTGLSILLVGLLISGMAQTLGFQGAECGLVANPDYHFDNFSYGSHGSGYVLYHFGTVILAKEESLYSIGGNRLKFTNDAGFFMDYGYPSAYNLYKITGNNYVKIGDGTGYCEGLYVLNDHICYLVIDFRFSGWTRNVTIARCSDIMPLKYVVHEKPPDSSMTVHDTIPGTPLCSGLSELHFKLLSGTDTLTYTIILHVDSALSTGNRVVEQNLIYPNPASDYIRLKPIGNEPSGVVSFMDMMGVTCRIVTVNAKDNPAIYVGDLRCGIYLVTIRTKSGKHLGRMLKY